MSTGIYKPINMIDFIELIKKKFKIELYKEWDHCIEKTELINLFDNAIEEAVMDL